MGTSPSGLRLLGNGDSSCNVQLGEAFTINLKKKEKVTKKNDGKTIMWEVLYDVQEVPYCTLYITKTSERNSGEELKIEILDYTYADDSTAIGEETIIGVRKAEADLLDVTEVRRSFRLFVTPKPYTAKMGNSFGGETKTSFYAYGYGSRMSLVVQESKTRRGNEKPYMVTLSHYYVKSSSGGIFNNASGVDVGLSVVVKIRVLPNGRLDFNVDGPVEHPSSALFYMIQEATGTGTWKPTPCPHCVDLQRQRRSLWQSQSESEDNESPRRELKQIHCNRQSVGNSGPVTGNANGGFLQAKNINFL